MFQNIKKPIAMNRILIALLFFFSGLLSAQNQKVWIDADSGNETDDIYAVARILVEPTVDVVGVSSAHFNNADLVSFEKWNQYLTAGINTVQISQQLNEALLASLEKSQIPHPLGADRQIGRAWGGNEPRQSAATEQLVWAVKNLKKGEKLDVLCLGALTNIASAVILDPSILPFIRCFALGAKYNENTHTWSKNEFNIRNDLNAFDYLLNCKEFDFTIMTIDACLQYRFERDVLYAKLDNTVPVQKIMKDRWEETNPQDKVRTLWDLALIEAYLNPNMTTIKKVNTPPENIRRKVKIYSNLNIKGLTADFWESINLMKLH